MRQNQYRHWGHNLVGVFFCALGCLAFLAAPVTADPETTEQAPPTLTEEAAIVWALERNPELAALRTQRGIAAGAVVIAQTYPFNPIWEGRIQANSGPASAGITNLIANEHLLLLELELRGQGTYRREGAYAAQSRTDWEIAHQEILLSVRVIRAFEGVLYRQEKLDLLNETVDLDQRTYDLVRKLVGQGRLHGPDEIVARLELDDIRA